MDRRELLKLVAVAGMAGNAVCATSSNPPVRAGRSEKPPLDWRQAVLGYLESLARPDGGYGWDDQPDSHLTPTFAVIGCYKLFNQDPPNKKALAEFVRTHHPITGQDAEAGKHAAELRTFVYQQVQSLLWLNEDASSFHSQVQGWTEPSKYPVVYEPNGYPVFQQEMMAIISHAILGLPFNNRSPEVIEYLNSRRRPNGSFNHTPASDGSDGNVLNTLWGTMALLVFGGASERKEETVAWLRACQLPSGGFTHQPNAQIGRTDDVTYTWAAVRMLKSYDAAPADREACVRWLRLLWNGDGGFGDRPGLPSQPVATCHALDALITLGETPGTERRPAAVVKALPARLKPFTIQLEAQGNGSPAEAVELARALRIHLWGAKNALPGWIARAQAIADQRKVPVRFFVANEEYGTFMSLPGLGTYSHLSDPIAPAGVDFGPSLAGERATAWPEFLARRIAPLEKAGGRMVWQICDNEEFVRVQLDDSVERGSGYAAISSFHFQQNFVYMLPFLFRYRHLIPFVALQDAHGNEAWWWADELAGYRTVFLGAEPTWAAWLKALKEQWVVAVRHDAVTKFRTRMLGGGPGVQDFIRRHEKEWKWWEENPVMIRPWVSLVAVTPGDEFEAARPEEGVTIRVRCWWQGRVARVKPVVELVSLSVDGKPVKPTLVEEGGENAGKAVEKGKGGKGRKGGKGGKGRKGGKGGKGVKGGKGGDLSDCYHTFHLPASARGKHTATATVRMIETGKEAKATIHFTVA